MHQRIVNQNTDGASAIDESSDDEEFDPITNQAILNQNLLILRKIPVTKKNLLNTI